MYLVAKWNIVKPEWICYEIHIYGIQIFYSSLIVLVRYASSDLHLFWLAPFSSKSFPIIFFFQVLSNFLFLSRQPMSLDILLYMTNFYLPSVINNFYFPLFQGLWFNRDSHLWMLPHMTDDLLNLLLKNSISSVQQLLVLPKQHLQSVVGSSTASWLYQVGVNIFFWVSCMYLLLLTSDLLDVKCKISLSAVPFGLKHDLCNIFILIIIVYTCW